MPWTYNAGALDQPLNAVRLMIGDTNTSDQQLQDEEILSFIAASGGNVASAAASAAKALAFKYARSVDKWVGDLKILASQRHRAYSDLYDKLLAVAGGGSASLAVPSAGGIRYSQKEAIREDSDLVRPSFRRGMHDISRCED